MSYVYALYRFTDPSKPFYIGETGRPEERVREHSADYMSTAHKTWVLMDEASKDGGITLRLLFDTPGKSCGTAVEALISYLLHGTIINPKVEFISNLVRFVTYDSIRNIKITPHGKQVINQYTQHTGTPIQDFILETLLGMCVDTAPDEEYSRLIDTRHFNMGHKFIMQYKESLK